MFWNTDLTPLNGARGRSWRALWLSVAFALTAPVGLPASPAAGRIIPNSTPGFVTTAQNLGPEDGSKVIDVTIWLNLRNRDEFDSLGKELYDPASPHYRQWLTRTEFADKFAPTAQQAKTVQDFLSSHNLQIVTVGPENGFVRARGTVAAVNAAFHVQLSKFDVNGETHRGNTGDPYIDGPAASLVKLVSGLDDLEVHQPIATRTSHPSNHKSPLTFDAASSAPDAAFFSNQCFAGVKTETYSSTPPFPPATATYTGNGYFSPLLGLGCGYTPAEIQTAYNLTGLYKEGHDGTGQTIIIIDFCGSPTILQDANAFSARFGLPLLNSSNFRIINYPTPSACAGEDIEINTDVEWAHAIAPGAAIDLVIAPTASLQDSDEALYFAAISGLGNVISGSYGSLESALSFAELINESDLTEIAAFFGVSANFATGDEGDLSQYSEFPTVLVPASTVYATAVGGVSLALNANNSIAFQTGWGENETALITTYYGEVYIFDPPINSGFQQGSGGGTSRIFAKAPGEFRKLPDISWLADPLTGAVIVATVPDEYPPQVWAVIGGTSLSCPMFSALWAIANQEAGMPLGQAAAYLYSMPKGTIADVVPFGSATNVTGTIQESGAKATHYSAAELAAPLDGTTEFYSFLWDDPSTPGMPYVLTLGTDSSLKTAIGWDDVTGLGTPNGKAFADYFNPAGRQPAP